MQTKIIEVYEYSELEPAAKEKALSKWNEYNDDPYMQSHMINLLKEELDERGIKYDGDTIDVRYSLSYSQGDGFMFIGTVYYKDQAIKITHGDAHYCHEYTARFDEGELSAELFESFKELYREICRKLAAIGYEHIEYITSEEYFVEACEANGYTFRKDGTMENI